MTLSRTNRLPLVAAALWLAACSPKSPTETTAATTAPASATLPVAMELGPTLPAYHWRLESATDVGGQSISALFPGPENLLGLEFASGRLGVTGGCNRIGAGFQLVEVSKLQLGPATSTMMGCPPPLAAADEAMASFLSGTLQAEVQGDARAPVLRLSAVDGRVLDFKGTPTPETRFGGPGTLAFLEVSPKPCEAPASSTTCLKVRDRNFDEHGLRSGEPGEWRALPGGIEGYATSPGQQEVVRVKRFETAGAEPVVHFVFDMVVESVTVQ